MMVPMDNVIGGITAYFRGEVLPHLPTTGVKGFGVGFAASLAINRIETIIRQLAGIPVVAMLGVVDDGDKVDIDALREAALQAMPEDGISIQLTNQHRITFGVDDVHKLYKLITR